MQAVYMCDLCRQDVAFEFYEWQQPLPHKAFHICPVDNRPHVITRLSPLMGSYSPMWFEMERELEKLRAMENEFPLFKSPPRWQFWRRPRGL